MQQTTNYQLSQWEKTDRILMEDFNRDNLIIENGFQALKAALTAERQAREAAVAGEQAERRAEIAAVSARKSLIPICTAALETSGRYVSMPLGAIDWSQWKAVYFCMTLYLQESGYIDIVMGGTEVAQSHGGGLSAEGTPNPIPVNLMAYPLYDAGTGIKILPIGVKSDSMISAGTSFADLTSISFRAVASGNQVLAGCTCKIFGER